MDINSLLSPSESPAAGTTPNPRPSRSPHLSPKRTTHRPLAQQRKSSGLSHQVMRSPLAQEAQQSGHPPNLAYSSHQQYHESSPMTAQQTGYRAEGSAGAGSWTLQPERKDIAQHSGVHRHASTPGMDTLADLASMQQQQHSSRSAQVVLHDLSRAPPPPGPPSFIPSVLTPPLVASPSFASPAGPGKLEHRVSYMEKHHSRPPAASRSVSEVSRGDAGPTRKEFICRSLNAEDQEMLVELSAHISSNPLDLAYHNALIGLLHKGYLEHVRQDRRPQDYELLEDLRQARQVMDRLCPLGEPLWRDYLEDEMMLARTLDERVSLMELFGRAVSDEPSSTMLWALYGEYMYHLWEVTHHGGPNGADSVSSEEQPIALEVFKWDIVISVWESGVDKTRWNLADSNMVWDRYMQILLSDLERSPSVEKVHSIRQKFEDRLLREPHATWDSTFQAFSSFVSRYEEHSYETLMSDLSRKAKQVRQIYQHREAFELKIAQARKSENITDEWQAYIKYLDWEVANKGIFSWPLINGLFERAIVRFPRDHSLWLSYIEFLIKNQQDEHFTLTTTERASRHCPWSGELWSHQILAMEAAGKDFHEIEDVKHTATSSGLLDAGDMDELLKVYIAWCGCLRRRAFEPGAAEEAPDIAEVGIRSALDYVQEIGEKKVGKADYKGDRQYRLERIYIKFLTQRGDVAAARHCWRSLTTTMGDSYEFWYRYYIWEMVLWAKFAMRTSSELETQLQAPREATSLLEEALERSQTMDYPEELVRMYLNHCEQHETIHNLRFALVRSRETMEAIARRRDQQAASVAFTQASAEADAGRNDKIEASNADQKRKRLVEDERPDSEGKRQRSDEQIPVAPVGVIPVRDREHTQVVVKGLPQVTTEARLRQFFRDCGTIHSIKLSDDSTTKTATVEFDTAEDALFAQTKSAKLFDDIQLEIEAGAGTTLWVTNYPPTADEIYMRELFRDCGEVIEIRFPSLQGNARRRFCYVQFSTQSEAARASQLDGKVLEGGLALNAKISDPSRRGQRHGAMEEGREVYVQNVHWEATEAEIKELFEQCGPIEAVRIPRKAGNGQSKGIAFLDFEDKESARKSVEQLHGSSFRNRKLRVEISKSLAKRTITLAPQSDKLPASPARTDDSSPGNRPTNGETSEHRALETSAEKVSRAERSVAILNIPDTVTAARVEELLSPFGALRKMILRTDHGGAIAEFVDAKSVGLASLELEGREFAGAKLRIGTVEELLESKPNFRPSTIAQAAQVEKATAAKAHPTKPFGSGVVSRPGMGRGKGRRGGLGQRLPGKDGQTAEAGREKDTSSPGKSNADFRAMIGGRGN